MKLSYIAGDDVRAKLYIDGDAARQVTVRGPDATKIAKTIARRINMHDSMIAVLRVFATDGGMGAYLIDAMVSFGEGDPRQGEVERRIRAVINAVDVILKGAEVAEREQEIQN